MTISLQVLYPASDGTTFDFDYYTTKHFALVGEHFGPHIKGVQAIKGIAGGPGAPVGYHAVATLLFSDQAALEAGLAASGPVLADIPNFTNATPQMLIGEVIG
jgi:uncharacterized protein (TIGR02118 family)